MEVKVRLSGEILHGGEENAYIYRWVRIFACQLSTTCAASVCSASIEGNVDATKNWTSDYIWTALWLFKASSSALFLYYCLITKSVKLKYCTEVTCRCPAAARFSSERIKKIWIKFCIRLFTLNLMGNT